MLSKPTVTCITNDEELFLTTDASRLAACGILLQKRNNEFYPIQFFSKQFSESESRYPSIRRELYAIFFVS